MQKLAEIKLSYTNKNQNNPIIKSSTDAYKILMANWDKSTLELREEFKVIPLDRSGRALGIYTACLGGVASTIVDPKLIFAMALKIKASSIILAHNHPSGNLKESKADLNVTERLVLAGDCLDIKVLDHFIVTKKGYLSFADTGLM